MPTPIPDFYFSQFENRQPPPPLSVQPVAEFLWQILATMNLVVGAWYISWRWCCSIDYASSGIWYSLWWFSLPLAAAETCAYFGLVLFTFNLWKVQDTPRDPPPKSIKDCVPHPDHYPDHSITVDIFFPTVNEEPELVRLSIKDAKQITYPHPLTMKIHVLDDGRRSAMRQVAEEEGVNYIVRQENIGFKAGNLAHAMEQTSGDFIVICDADTRPFPTLLEHTLGYFRDPDVAWVQTPQWFYDIPAGRPLSTVWQSSFGNRIARAIECLVGPVQIGHDPLINDPQMFYDIILRRRNGANAAFCCGAGSIHRRDAVMEAALKGFSEAINNNIRQQQRLERQLNRTIERFFAKQHLQSETVDEYTQRIDMAKSIPLAPYKFHVSEDIYTSIILHSDVTHRWKSVQHPQVESKMLSPQDLQSWMVQRFKYAGGTLDIMLRDRMLFRPGLSLCQRLMYGATLWSYLGGIWNLIFLLGPLVYLFSGISPVSAYTPDFFKHILPFLLLTELAFMTGTWGLNGFPGKASYLAFFSVNLRALLTVLKGKKIKFPVTPKERQEGNFFYLILPQFTISVLTLIGIVYAWAILLGGAKSHTFGGVIINTFWGTYNIIALSTLIRAAFWKPQT
ncbi:MAG: glycosyltransferase [Candidatus Electrothrix gigas]